MTKQELLIEVLTNLVNAYRQSYIPNNTMLDISIKELETYLEVLNNE